MNLANICYFFLIFSHFTYYIILGIGMNAYAEALGNGFLARDITFRNTTGLEKEQAVAMRVSSNHSIFYCCSFEASKDTVYVESNLQFYAHTRSCTRCTLTVKHEVRTRGLGRGAHKRSRTWCPHAVARVHGRAQVMKNTCSFKIKKFFFFC